VTIARNLRTKSDSALQRANISSPDAMNKTRCSLNSLLLLAASAGLLVASQPHSNAQTATPPPGQGAQSAPEVPVMDGAAGPCAVQITVTTADGNPVFDAEVKVHIAYRFGGFHKLDLEAGTNAQGKVKFVGLPARVRRPPLEFQASKDQLAGVLTYDPATECQATRSITLEKPKSTTAP